MYRSPHRWGGTGEEITLCSAHRPMQQAIFPSELKASRDKSRLRVSRATRSPPTPIYHHMPPSGSIQWYLPGCRSGRGRAVPPRCHRDCVAPPPGRPGHVAPGPRRARTAGPQVAAWRERLVGRGRGGGGVARRPPPLRDGGRWLPGLARRSRCPPGLGRRHLSATCCFKK